MPAKTVSTGGIFSSTSALAAAALALSKGAATDRSDLPRAKQYRRRSERADWRDGDDKSLDFAGLAHVGTVVDIGHERAVVRTGASTFHGLVENLHARAV
jgi:hypothetical protein